MTDKELLYIKTIAEERNISLAARKLFMTQPALSHCLISLEKETGTPLFVRTPGGLNMTYAGECFYSMAVDILDIYNDYQQKLVDISQMRKGRVQIGMTRYLSAMLLPRVLPEFSRMYPNVEIHLKEKNSQDLEQDVAARKLDFALIHGFDADGKKIRGSLEYRTLNRDNFCIIMQKGMAVAEKAVRMTGYPHPVLDLKLLEKEPFILETQDHRMRVVSDGILRRVNVEPRILLETDLFETALRLVEVGYGVTLVNESYIKTFSNVEKCDVFSIPKKYKPYWSVCVIRHAKGYMPAASQEFLDMIEARQGKPD
ncbi:MAG: LysR family transcriptional regulator [Lachnospiraceae bacterium]|jgi:DNA-binding transcriptional LysR family regulator|nr:LysR family transcriptional regulator [Lachnospiraceae bacterium]MCI8958036.1 LysR family transcriptional regulator [Lachnospiraceae bacterium]